MGDTCWLLCGLFIALAGITSLQKAHNLVPLAWPVGVSNEVSERLVDSVMGEAMVCRLDEQLAHTVGFLADRYESVRYIDS